MAEAKKRKGITRGKKQESFNELCNFADEFGLRVELDKPFNQFDNLILNVVRKEDGKLIEQVIMEDITVIDQNSAKLLNELIKHKKQ